MSERSLELYGAFYHDVLRRFHELLDPRAYLEIGTETGKTLALSNTNSIAIDPAFRLGPDVIGAKPMCALYQMPSDRFFADHDPRQIFGRPVDLGFLDGMHLFEYLLRDFINTERVCNPNSLLLMHDCIPQDNFMTVRDPDDHAVRERSTNPAAWTGDVWKVVPILQKYRPDLRVTALDARPTGLIAITNLDPKSSVLAEKYYDIVDEFRNADEQFSAFFTTLNIVSTDEVMTRERIASRFWI